LCIADSKISPDLGTLKTVKRLTSFLLLLVFLPLTSIPLANSIEMPGGTLAIGTNRVLTMAIGVDARTPFCSMAMITDQIVVTAAHCVAKNKTDDGSLWHPLEKLYVTQPGVDVRSDDVRTRVKVGKVFFPVRYEAFFDSSIGDLRGAQNDIAFLFLEKALVSGYSIPVATRQEFESIQTSGFAVEHFGYGLQNQNGADGKPYSITSLTRARKYGFENDPTQLISGDYGFPSVCSGDSGGPVYGTFSGVYKLIAVVNGGGGCFPNLGPTSGAYSRAIFSYLDSALNDWKKFEIELKAKQEAKAKAAAELKAKQEADAKAVAALKAVQEAEAKAAVELKAKQEAEAAVAAAKAAANKKTTITCVKGKLTKKVTALKPNCPTGYKLKK
jgi:hypothetical protein